MWGGRSGSLHNFLSFLCKKNGNPITRKSDCQWTGFVICMHDFFDQIRELRTNESPKLDLCAQKCEWVIRTENVWNSFFFKGPSSQIESIHLKAHLRRPYVYDFFHCYGLNQSVWRHLFANCMSRNNFFHWYGLNQTIWRYIYAYTMDSHSAMQWSSGNQLFFPQILFCFILHVAASWLFLLWV